MSKHVNNKYSAEADDMFSMGGGGSSFGSDFGGSSFGGGFGTSSGSEPSVNNGLKPQDMVIVRGMKRLRKLLGISFPKEVPKQKVEQKVNLFAYTPDELKYQPGFAQGAPYPEYDKAGNPASLHEYLNKTVQEAAAWDKEAKSFNVLSPEINSARDVMVSSIMSPVDMQTSSVSVVVDGSGLSKEIEDKLTTIFTDYFNDQIHLARRMYKWIGNALYEDGGTPILILPQSNVYTLTQILDIDELKAGRDPQKLIEGIKPTQRSDSAKVSSGEALQTNIYSSFESLNIGNDGDVQYNDFLDNTVRDCLYGIESLDFLSDTDKNFIITKQETFKSGLKTMLDKGRNWIRFSSDPSVLKKHTDSIKTKIANIQKNIDDHLIVNSSNPTYILDTSVVDKKDVAESAAIVELPYASVIPVIVPGAPNEHIGYFVVVDQWGDPISPETRDMNNLNTTSRLMEANMQAMFGASSALAFSSDMSNMVRFRTTSSIFGIMLSNFMKNKLEEYGLAGTHVEQHEAITTCIFRNLLDRKKIGLIFVPEPMMVYYRFKTHTDGTGKALIEDIRTITALRTTLITAGIMAATENSIDQKVVEVNVDEKNANIQQLLEQVKNAFVEKRIMRYDNNPLNVQREIIQKSLMLVPKGIRGLQDSLSINTEHRNQSSVTPDDSLRKDLTDMEIQGLQVPQSALDKTSEYDYARSITTTNMFFNNKVKMYQDDVNGFTTKLVKSYIKYSSKLKNDILEVLRSTDEDYKEYSNEAQELSPDQKEKEQKKAGKLRKSNTHEHQSTTKVEEEKKSINQQLLDIIDHTSVSLPKPRIVVDKSQYEEITGFADCVDKVCSIIYNEELLPDELQEYATMLKVLRARIREKLIRDFIKTVGFQSVFDLPVFKDLDTDDSEELIMQLINYKKGMTNIKEQISDKLNMGPQQGSDTGMGGGFGGSDFGGNSGLGGSGLNEGGIGAEMPGSIGEEQPNENGQALEEPPSENNENEESEGSSDIDLPPLKL